jgi:hypothetical protein
VIVTDVRPDVRVDDVKPYVYGLDLLWGAALGAAFVYRRRLSSVALAGLGLPLVALLPYAVYDLVVYYPRHPVIGWLAMDIAVLLVCSPRSSSRPNDRGEAPSNPLRARSIVYTYY